MEEFKELDEMDIPAGSLHRGASKVGESRKAVKEANISRTEVKP